jgi:LemA protein
LIFAYIFAFEKPTTIPMSESDQALENYIKKLMDLQYQEQPDKQWSDEDLKNIALEAGLTERAWEASQQKGKDHLARGKAFLTSSNWEDAVTELEQAATLLPNSAEANGLAGKAYVRRGSAEDNANDLERAAYFLNRSLSINPNYQEALTLKSELNRNRNMVQNASVKKARSGKWLKWGLIGGAVLLVIIWYFSSYNTMVAAEENTVQAWAQVENVYQRRADLIPNLVETVKASAEFERETLNEVIQARAAATAVTINPEDLDAAALEEFNQKQNALSASLGRLLAVAENYPTLRSTENFRDLQSQLEGSENRITVERKRFNEAVLAYNAKARKFPYNLLGFDTKAYFSTDPANQEAPEVNFN